MVRRSSRFLAHVIGGLLAALALGAGALGVRLSQGPLSLDFLTPYVQQALADVVPEYRVAVGGTRLIWGGFEESLDIEVTDVVARDSSGQVVATIPAAAVGLSVPALLLGTIAPTSVELRNPDAILARTADGRFALGIGTEEPETAKGLQGEQVPGRGLIDGIVDDLLGSEGAGGAAAYMTRLAITDAKLVIVDAVSGKTWRAPGADITLVRDASGMMGGFDLPLEVAGAQTSVSGSGRFDAAAQRAILNVRLTNLLPAAFGDLDPALAPLAALGVPLSGTASVEFGSSAGDRRMAFDLSGGDGILTLPDRYPEPLPISRLSARGTVDFGASRATLDRIDLVARGASFGGTLAFSYGEAGVGVEGNLDLGSVDTATFVTLWPAGIAPGGRAWVAENISNGRVTGAAIDLKAAPGALDATPTPPGTFVLTFGFEGLDIHYLGDLPVIKGANGSGKVDYEHLEMQVDTGAADLGTLGKLEVSKAALRITEFAAVDQIGDIELSLQGPATAVAGLLDRAPLGYPSRYDIVPASLSGKVAGRLHFRLPLRADVPIEDVTFEVEARLSGFGMPPLWRDLPITGGDLGVKVDQKGLRATGTADVGGIPARLDWREVFEPGRNKPGTTLDIAADLNEAARARLALPEAERITGTFPATLRLTGKGPAISSVEIGADLGPAAIDLAIAGWTKAPGLPARLDMVMMPRRDGSVGFEQVVAKADGLNVAGRFDLDGAGNLARVQFERARIGPNDAGLDLSHASGTPWTLHVSGSTLDLGPWQEAEARKPPGDGRLPDLSISGTLQRLALRRGVTLDGVSATLETRNNKYQSASLDGRFASGEQLTMRINQKPGGRELSARTRDAAALIRLLGIYDNAEGGSLNVNSVIDDTRPLMRAEGELVIEGLRLRRAPILARILTLGSLTGISDTLQGEGIWFERLHMPFVQEGEVLRVFKARAFGPALGLTADGSIDRRHETLSLAGTIVPAYTLNSVLGSLPLIGRLLTGGVGEGVFALNFTLVGPMGDPAVSVNPLSALAPGILREIMGVLDGTNAAARTPPAVTPSSPAPAPAPAPKP